MTIFASRERERDATGWSRRIPASWKVVSRGRFYDARHARSVIDNLRVTRGAHIACRRMVFERRRSRSKALRCRRMVFERRRSRSKALPRIARSRDGISRSRKRLFEGSRVREMALTFERRPFKGSRVRATALVVEGFSRSRCVSCRPAARSTPRPTRRARASTRPRAAEASSPSSSSSSSSSSETSRSVVMSQMISWCWSHDPPARQPRGHTCFVAFSNAVADGVLSRTLGRGHDDDEETPHAIEERATAATTQNRVTTMESCAGRGAHVLCAQSALSLISS